MTQIWSARRDRRDIFFIAITSCIYAAITLFVTFHHEPWRDEADVWLAARDLRVDQLWAWLHHVGSPSLWYLLVMPLAKMNAPYFSMNLLHWAFAVLTVALILALAPFPRIIRLAIVFSYHMGFEYAVIARNYVLLVLLLVLIAWLYRRRYEAPLLLGLLFALAANTSVHGIIIAGALLGAWGLDALYHHRVVGKVLLGAIIAALGFILALAQVFPSPPDGQLPGATAIRNPTALGKVLTRTFLPVYPASDGRTFAKLHQHPPLFITAWTAPRILNLILFAGVIWLLRRNPPVLIAFLLAFITLLYLFVFKYLGGERHIGLIWVMVWITLWILLDDPVTAAASSNDRAVWKWGMIPVAISLIYSTGMCIYYWQLDTRFMFSGSREAADFLITHNLADRPLGLMKENFCEPILPYLGHKSAWFAGIGREGTYMPWNRQWEVHNAEPFEPGIERLVAKSAIEPRMVLILNTELPVQYNDQFQEVFNNFDQFAVNSDERYTIYIRRLPVSQ